MHDEKSIHPDWIFEREDEENSSSQYRKRYNDSVLFLYKYLNWYISQRNFHSSEADYQVILCFDKSRNIFL